MPPEPVAHNFLGTLIVASLMVAITVINHFFGLAVLIRFLRKGGDPSIQRWQHITKRMVIIMFVVFGLFAVHTVQIRSYAVLYHFVLGAIDDFETALYFSTVSFVSLGYGDVILPKQWLLIGAIEAVNGLILMGWSTNFFSDRDQPPASPRA
jgi:hypothetical protein